MSIHKKVGLLRRKQSLTLLAISGMFMVLLASCGEATNTASLPQTTLAAAQPTSVQTTAAQMSMAQMTPTVATSTQTNVSQGQFKPIDWKLVEQAIGKAGALMPGDVYRVNFPRSDLQVMVRGVLVKPSFALGTYAAFKQIGDNQVMVMGDTVLTEDELAPVQARLRQGGIEPTGIHNNLFNPNPGVLYMHIGGVGDPVKLAETIKAALALTKTPFTSPAAASNSELDLDTKQLDQLLGYQGKVNGGIYQFTIGRNEKIMEHGVDLPVATGVATVLNFQPTGNGKAAITGDFAMLQSEVPDVTKALTENGIEITALHSHMLDEDPHLFYMHFWGNDDALKLAHGLRAALDKTNSAK